MKHVKPMFFLDITKSFHFCFQEALLSSIILTMYLFLTDFVEEYIDHQSISKLQKYLLTMVIMFVASFVSIMFILFIFGYDCGKKK